MNPHTTTTALTTATSLTTTTSSPRARSAQLRALRAPLLNS